MSDEPVAENPRKHFSVLFDKPQPLRKRVYYALLCFFVWSLQADRSAR